MHTNFYAKNIYIKFLLSVFIVLIVNTYSIQASSDESLKEKSKRISISSNKCEYLFKHLGDTSTQRKYKPSYQLAKFSVYNGFGFFLSGWPLWYFPELHLLYRNKLNDSQKLKLQRYMRSKDTNVLPSKYRSKVRSIKKWNRARRVWLILLSLLSIQTTLEEVIPLEYLIKGKQGLVEFKTDKIIDIYKSKLDLKVDRSFIEDLVRSELEKPTSQLLTEIYKDSLKGESND